MLLSRRKGNCRQKVQLQPAPTKQHQDSKQTEAKKKKEERERETSEDRGANRAKRQTARDIRFGLREPAHRPDSQ